jgi:PKD repeat protein
LLHALIQGKRKSLSLNCCVVKPGFALPWRKWGAVGFGWMLCSLLLLICLCPRLLLSASFDYSAPLQNVTAGFSGNAVSYDVFDPAQGRVESGSIAGVNTSDLKSTNGVVAFSSGATIYYLFYDPYKTNWVQGSVGSGTTSDLKCAQGVVTWSSGTTVYYRVYDMARGNWMAGSTTIPATTFDLNTAQGVVAWTSGTTTYFTVYDPGAGAWRSGSQPSGSIFNFKNKNGVVAWSSSPNVFVRTYDPTRGGWFGSDVNTGSTSDLVNETGVVAWSAGTTVFFKVYDSMRSNWVASSVNSGAVFGLAVNGGTVTWSSSTSFRRGYIPSTGSWIDAVSLPQAAFYMSTNSVNAPLKVYFVDMSLAASAWNWSFGDGGISSQRSPFYTYRGFGRYTVSLTVSGIGGSTFSTNVAISDITAPFGTIQINGTNAVVTSNQVTLTLSATDNSGVVAAIRFANENGAFSDWEPYATSKTWLLSAGDGLKTVKAQFKDAVDNISTNAIDTIQLDTTPFSLAHFEFANTNIAENAGGYTVRVLLNNPFTRVLSVDYATSDGTANAGSDYTTTTGRLVFQPGEVVKFFTVPITDDSLVEMNEYIQLTLSNPTNAVLGSPATITIMDNDPPAIAFTNASYTVNENAGGAIITLALSPASGQTVSVDYGVSNGTATAGADYSAVGGTLVFAPGQLSQSFTIPILNDVLDETNETVMLFLRNPVNGVLGTVKTAVLTILDDDPPTVRFTTNFYSANESSGNASIVTTLSKSYSQPVSVDITTGGGSASPGSDYISVSTTISFTPGLTSKTTLVTLLNDIVAETNETFGITLNNCFNCTLGLATATVLIQDDDVPQLSARATNGTVQVTITGKAGQHYSLEGANSLGAWSQVTTLNNTSGTVVYDVPPPAAGSSRFYRVQVLP